MATRVNGRFWSYVNVEIALIVDEKPREVIAEIPDISYSHNAPREHVYGSGSHPLGQTTPRYEPQDGSVSFYAQRYRELIASLGDDYASFTLKFTVKMRDGTGPLFVDELEGFIAGDSHGPGQGSGALVAEVPIMWTLIKINGKLLVGR